jgi:hypothetical protein
MAVLNRMKRRVQTPPTFSQTELFALLVKAFMEENHLTGSLRARNYGEGTLLWYPFLPHRQYVAGTSSQYKARSEPYPPNEQTFPLDFAHLRLEEIGSLGVDHLSFSAFYGENRPRHAQEDLSLVLRKIDVHYALSIRGQLEHARLLYDRFLHAKKASPASIARASMH